MTGLCDCCGEKLGTEWHQRDALSCEPCNEEETAHMRQELIPVQDLLEGMYVEGYGVVGEVSVFTDMNNQPNMVRIVIAGTAGEHFPVVHRIPYGHYVHATWDDGPEVPTDTMVAFFQQMREETA